MSKPFLYLVQSAGQLPDHYNEIAGETADLIHLAFKDDRVGDIFFPKSSWTTGRNRLLQEARKRLNGYQYVILADDDVAFDRGGWRAFEDIVLRHRPAIAVPYCPWYPSVRAPVDGRDVQQCEWYDAIYNAVHVDIVRDSLVLPYLSDFDAKSWWFSQWFFIKMAGLFYRGHVVQVNGVAIRNDEHSVYPTSGDFSEVEAWFEQNVALPRKASIWRRVHSYVAWRFGLNGSGLPVRPRSGRASYGLSAERVRDAMVGDTSRNPFYRSYRNEGAAA